jgi:hypothetical protein
MTRSSTKLCLSTTKAVDIENHRLNYDWLRAVGRLDEQNGVSSTSLTLITTTTVKVQTRFSNLTNESEHIYQKQIVCGVLINMGKETEDDSDRSDLERTGKVKLCEYWSETSGFYATQPFGTPLIANV